MKNLCVIGVALFYCSVFLAQGQRPAVPGPVEEFNSNRPSNVPTSLAGEDYRVGRDDLLEVNVFEAQELNTISRVTASGQISMPLLGSIQADGMTPLALAKLIESMLKKQYVKDPHVIVFIREYASQPVSVVGAVKVPGIYQIKGQKFLLDMIATAQGLDQAAGNTVQILRRQAPQAGKEDPAIPAQETSSITLTINTEELFQNGKAELNVPIYANDVINVLKAGSIFVVGELKEPGEKVLRNGKEVTVSQAIALGGGFNSPAKRSACIIIRHRKDGTREEIPVNAQKILEKSATDIQMLSNDILFVPANKLKTGFNRALDSFISVAVGRAIYGR